MKDIAQFALWAKFAWNVRSGSVVPTVQFRSSPTDILKAVEPQHICRSFLIASDGHIAFRVGDYDAGAKAHVDGHDLKLGPERSRWGPSRRSGST